MPEFKAIYPTTFVYNGNTFQTFVRVPYGLGGFRKLDECCEEWVLLTLDNKVFVAKGKGKPARQKVIRDVATFVVDTYQMFKEQGKSIWTLPDGQMVMAFSPTVTSGTSAGTTYNVLAITGAGIVSYAHNDLLNQPRLRMALHSELVGQVAWSKTDRIVSDVYPNLTFETTEPTHMAKKSSGKAETIALIARSLEASLRLQGI